MGEQLHEVWRQVGHSLNAHREGIRKAKEQAGKENTDGMVHTKHRRGHRDPTPSIAHVAGEQFQVTNRQERAAQGSQCPTDHQRERLEQNGIDAHRLCGEAESAKDLVQETFLNAYRGLKDFRGDARVSTWLYTIASRACLRMRRKRKGAPERELSLEELVPTSDGEFRLQIPIDGLTPEQALEKKARSGQAKPEELRGEQSAVKQGLDNAAQKLQQEGQKTSLLSGRSQRAVAEAEQKVSDATQ